MDAYCQHDSRYRVVTREYNVCSACGHVFADDPLFVIPKDVHWEELIRSALYKHSYHANERDKQWQMCEPKIPKDDMERIFAACSECYPPDDPQTPPDNTWGQVEVRRILRSIGPSFVKKYLEKWRTIVKKLTGIKRPIPEDDLVAAIHKDFVALVIPMLEYTRKEIAPSGKPRHNLRPLDSIYLVLLHKHKRYEWFRDFYMIKSPKKYKEFMACMEYSFNYLHEHTSQEQEQWKWAPLPQSMFPLKPTFSRRSNSKVLTELDGPRTKRQPVSRACKKFFSAQNEGKKRRKTVITVQT